MSLFELPYDRSVDEAVPPEVREMVTTRVAVGTEVAAAEEVLTSRSPTVSTELAVASDASVPDAEVFTVGVEVALPVDTSGAMSFVAVAVAVAVAEPTAEPLYAAMRLLSNEALETSIFVRRTVGVLVPVAAAEEVSRA